MASTIRIISGAAEPHDRCVRAPLAGSLNGALARRRCIGMDHATFEVEEAVECRVRKMVFARLDGVCMAGTVDHVDGRAGIVTVAWKRDAGTRGKVGQVLRSVVYGRFNGFRMAA